MIVEAASTWKKPQSESDENETQEGVLDFYYEHFAGRYWGRDSRNRYIVRPKESVKRKLKIDGLSGGRVTEGVNEVEKALETIETEKAVDYAAPLAGWGTGCYSTADSRVLVTQNPDMYELKKGSCKNLLQIIEGLLGEEQSWYFNVWLWRAFESLRDNKIRRGQGIIIAGPGDCGKSLLQSIITEILGRRIGKPYKFLTGETQFNSDLFGAVHQQIEDEATNGDPRVRKHLGGALKNAIANFEQWCHPKHGQPFVLKPLWRISFTVNDDANALQVLPQWEEWLRDKIMLFHAQSCELPVDTTKENGEDLLWALVCKEIPAYLHMISKIKIPDDRKNGRFGVKSYHSPSLLEMLQGGDEDILKEIIDDVLFSGEPGFEDELSHWEGTATTLEALLIKSDHKRSAGQMLFSNQRIGQLLAVIAKAEPDRYSRRLLDGRTLWCIQRPVGAPPSTSPKK